MVGTTPTKNSFILYILTGESCKIMQKKGTVVSCVLLKLFLKQQT